MIRAGRLTVIHQNDTHAHIDAHWELRWRDGLPEAWRAGGYAHIRAIANRIRNETRGACIHIPIAVPQMKIVRRGSRIRKPIDPRHFRAWSCGVH